GLGIALSEIITDPNIIQKFLVVASLLVVYCIFRILRTHSASHAAISLCIDCQQWNENACEASRQLFALERAFSRELSDHLQLQLNWKTLQTSRSLKE
ncbi:MAG TPA: hypothetical protein VJ044_16130, partial [Candidatus Hodarchaeales archaeon]|nr:hypothetical protein [Candidatus Hodarchaeales archaeon]